MDFELVQQFALSVGLGLLVGFQREWIDSPVAGVRTFALLTLMGTLCGVLVESAGAWLVPAGLIVVAIFLGLSALSQHDWEGKEGLGLTTVFAACVMFLVGAGLVFLPVEVPILLSGAVAVLLHWKQPIHWFIDRLGEAEVRAIMQLVLLALIILPLMPDRTFEFDPYQVLNPFDIWRLVVLICGISLVGYLASQFMGETASVWISGVVGGVISSTATTVTFSRQSKNEDEPRRATLIILIASTIVFGRVLFEVGVVAPSLVLKIWLPMAALAAVMAAVTVGFSLVRPLSKDATAKNIQRDPSELRSALVFGALYGVVLFGVAFAKDQFGNTGLYAVAALSGMTDMDAITLSTARMVQQAQVEADTGWRMIAIGFLSNLVFKFGIVAALGSRTLRKQVAVVFGLTFLGGVLIVLFWPYVP
jgi:uncharacterized membrane protein (DUF4010 family)